MKYDMVFEGGGAKGMVFVGAMEVFEAHGHSPGRLLGTSAGAITATFVAAGYTFQEMQEGLGETIDGRPVFADFLGVPAELDAASIESSAIRELFRNIRLPLIPQRFQDKVDDQVVAWLATRPSFRQIFSFVEHGGWYSADSFLSWLRRRLDMGVFKGQPRRFSHLTLKQFYEETKVDLTLIAANTTDREMLVLNHRTAPDLPLVWAVRMSMSVPLLWQEVVWQSDWGTYRHRDITGHAVVDGGLLSNFPLELFVARDARVTMLMGPKTNDNVLGLLIDDALAVPGAELAAEQARRFDVGELRTVQRILDLIDTTLSARDKMVIDAFENLVVRLPAKGYGTTEFDMSDERRDLIVQAGQEAMTAYFERKAIREMVSFGVAEATEAERAQGEADRLALKLLEDSR